jgi:hypothetical protein|tara:strand:+ start:267 stop:917 length:651 start_codon:yes stop_codon:yes gene_type:complete
MIDAGLVTQGFTVFIAVAALGVSGVNCYFQFFRKRCVLFLNTSPVRFYSSSAHYIVLTNAGDVSAVVNAIRFLYRTEELHEGRTKLYMSTHLNPELDGAPNCCLRKGDHYALSATFPSIQPLHEIKLGRKRVSAHGRTYYTLDLYAEIELVLGDGELVKEKLKVAEHVFLPDGKIYCSQNFASKVNILRAYSQNPIWLNLMNWADPPYRDAGSGRV